MFEALNNFLFERTIHSEKSEFRFQILNHFMFKTSRSLKHVNSDFSEWETGAQNLKHLNSEFRPKNILKLNVSLPTNIPKDISRKNAKIFTGKYPQRNSERTTYSTNQKKKRKYLARNH